MARKVYQLSAMGTMHVVCILCVSIAAMDGAIGEVYGGPSVLWSSTAFPDEELGPDNWRYYRVELPPMFSLLSISLTRNWSYDNNGSSTTGPIVPLVCFGFSGPPLPVIPRISLLEAARASGATQNASLAGECGWFTDTVAVNVTNLEVLSGTLHVGIFSNAEPSRTQSKMIDRGQRKYAFAMVTQVYWCGTDTLGGPECNMGIASLPRAFSQAPEALNSHHGRHLSSMSDRRHDVVASTGGETPFMTDRAGLRPHADSRRRIHSEVLQIGKDSARSIHMSPAEWSDWVPSGQECIKLDENQFFSLQVVDFVQEMEVKYDCISNVTHGISRCEEFESMVKESRIPLLHLRYGALPGRDTSDFLGEPSTASVTVPAPKRGWWYLAVFNPLVSRNHEVARKESLLGEDDLCLTLSMRARICGPGFTGSACQWPTLQLERILKGDVQSPFDSLYYPQGSGSSLQHDSEWFSLASFSNTSASNATAEQWAFAVLKLAGGTAGSALSVELEKSSDDLVELYARHESCPTSTNWDIRATTSASQSLSFDKRSRGVNVDKARSRMLTDSKFESILLPIVYPMEGYWCIGLKYVLKLENGRAVAPQNSSSLGIHPESGSGGYATLLNTWISRWRKYFVCSKTQFSRTMNPIEKEYEREDNTAEVLAAENSNTSPEESVKLRVVLQGCANDCSGHGQCKTAYEASRLHFISYCTCDVTHGDFDCSVVLLANLDDLKQRSALVFSNCAAILPSIWALRHQVYSEWITYTISGAASAIYHSCDAGGWCAMSYSTLQFLDFWLSFMAIIMTCLLMAGFSGATKSTMHLGSAVLTATIAKEDATSAWNILVVVVISIICLLMGWALETHRVASIRLWCLPAATPSRILATFLQSCRRIIWSFYARLRDRFHWDYLWCGLLVLSLALVSNKMEQPRTYWFWHSSWHVCIYTCTFILLLSIKNFNGPPRRSDPRSYQTVSLSQRQDSSDSGAESPGSPRSRRLELNSFPDETVH